MEKNEQIIRELGRAVNEVNQSNWMPITIILSFLGLVTFLVFIIVKRELKSNNDKHCEHEEKHNQHQKLIEKLSDISVDQKLIIKELQVMTKFHDREIQEIKNAS